MYGIDQDVPSGPWQLLIRARTEYEIDALIASVVVREVAAVGAEKAAIEVARAANAALAGSKGAQPAEPAARVAAIDALADYEERCGNGRHWPGPRPHWLSESNDPIAGVMIEALQGLVKAGSPGLGETLLPALEQNAR
jgi:hypothetical protein